MLNPEQIDNGRRGRKRRGRYSVGEGWWRERGVVWLPLMTGWTWWRHNTSLCLRHWLEAIHPVTFLSRLSFILSPGQSFCQGLSFWQQLNTHRRLHHYWELHCDWRKYIQTHRTQAKWKKVFFNSTYTLLNTHHHHDCACLFRIGRQIIRRRLTADICNKIWIKTIISSKFKLTSHFPRTLMISSLQ